MHKDLKILPHKQSTPKSIEEVAAKVMKANKTVELF
jgi:regulator of PEP synthase PpsR (kinase-PPPase family)